ncbi:MAG: ABC transporter ATP-binding protein [Dehalococcoidia bacterium]|nr:ABC transporter ATP-binding protein [Dehalococcoidia bacterium]
MELLQRLNHDGITVVAVLHDLALAARYTRRVIAMREGRVAFDGAPAEVMEPVGLAKVFGIAMTVLTDPERPADSIPRSKASLTPRDAIAMDRP